MPSLSEQDQALLATPDTKNYNFHSDYSVILDHPIGTVFPVLSHGDQIERMVRLSDLCSDFQLFDKDTVETPESTPLAEAHVRTEPPSTSELGFPRQFFRLQETVPLLFGLIKTKVEIVGAQTWDENAKVALYETVTNQGILVRKLRVFKEIEDDGIKKTSVSETINGTCPMWMKFIVQREATKGHRYVQVGRVSIDTECSHLVRRLELTWRSTTYFSDLSWHTHNAYHNLG